MKFIPKHDFMPHINHRYDTKTDYKIETLEEFLSRGGQIQKIPQGVTMYSEKFFQSRYNTMLERQAELRKKAKETAEKLGITKGQD